jgi:dATP pyrophosphohydrolase
MVQIVSKMIEVCVFSRKDGEVRFLLLRRSPDEKIYPGIWQFISGSVEDGEHAHEAALRELKEETGFEPQALWVVPHVNVFYDVDYDAVNLMPVFAAEVADRPTPTLCPEHSEFEWLPYQEALRRLVWPGQKEAMRIVWEYVLTNSVAGQQTRIG